MFYSVNSYSSASNRKGLGGLMSGLDTDELVKQMTSGTRSKIAAQLQKKQLAQWRQDAYRGIIDDLTNFKNKYFSTSGGSNNILSANFFNSSTIKTDSQYVKVSGSTTAAKNMVIKDIQQLAQTAGFTTSNRLSSQKIETGEILDSRYASLVNGSGLNIEFGGETHSVKISSDFAFSDISNLPEAEANRVIQQELVAELNKSIQANDKLKDKVEIGLNADGKVEISSVDGTSEFTLTGGTTALLEGLGLKDVAGKKGTVTTGGDLDFTKIAEKKALNDELAGTTLTLNYNGVSKNITFLESEKDQYSNAADLANYLQSKLDKTFGTGKVKVSENGGKLGFKTFDDASSYDNNTFSISSSDSSTILGGANSALKVESGASNRIVWNKDIKDILGQFGTALPPTEVNAEGKNVYKMTINGTELEFEETMSMSEVLNKINNEDVGVRVSYSTTSDTLVVTAKDSGANGQVKIEGAFAEALFGTAAERAETAGQDAVLTMSFDGGKTFSEVTRSTNSFSLDGVNIELKGMAEGTAEENISFDVEADTDELFNKVKDFVEEYNKIIKSISDKITEKYDNDYQPLTDEQKEEMSESQIENWEKQAKTGILQNDQYLSRLLSDLRTSLFSSVEGTDLALHKLGITTTDYKENGQLHITNEDKLKKALAEDPEGVIKLFTSVSGAGETKEEKAASGLAVKLSNVFERNVGTFGGDGILISVAGYKSDASISADSLSRQLRSIDQQLERLKDRLETEETRYYKQFSSLETYLNQMNAQASWISQQFGTTA